MFDPNLPFGGKSIIVFGDFFPLDPVLSPPLYTQVNREEEANYPDPLQTNTVTQSSNTTQNRRRNVPPATQQIGISLTTN